jgi:hypothetical protein
VRHFAAVAIVLAGCGGGGSSSGSVSLQDLPARAADVFCGAEAKCGEFPDKASCALSVTSNLGQLQADVATGKVTYDGAQARACLDSLSAAAAAGNQLFVSSWSIGVDGCRFSGARERPPAACALAFVGNVAEGGVCFVGLECASQNCALVHCSTAACCAGTCAPAESPIGSVAVGGACTSIDQCVPDAFCGDVPGGTGAVCSALQPAGAACPTEVECEAGTVCYGGSTTNGQLSCVKPPGEGEPCTDFTCDLRTDFCDPTTLKCTPRVAPGAACTPIGDEGCVHYARCDETTSKCVARGKVGDPCDANASFPCLFNLECTNGACAVPAAPTVCPQP